MIVSERGSSQGGGRVGRWRTENIAAIQMLREAFCSTLSQAVTQNSKLQLYIFHCNFFSAIFGKITTLLVSRCTRCRTASGKSVEIFSTRISNGDSLNPQHATSHVCFFAPESRERFVRKDGQKRFRR